MSRPDGLDQRIRVLPLDERIAALPVDHPGRAEMTQMWDEVAAGIDAFAKRSPSADLNATLKLWHALRARWTEFTGVPA